MPGDRYFGVEKEGYDSFGVRWTQLGPDPGLDGNTPTPGYRRVRDIANWRAELTLPDLDSLPLADIFRGMTAGIDREKYAVRGLMLSGLFERMNQLIGMEDALCAFYEEPEAVEDFFALKPRPTVHPLKPELRLPLFKGLAEAERMDPQAQRWKEDHAHGLSLLKQLDPAIPSDNSETLGKALDLFTRSVRSFPESPVARDCHLKRAQILEQLGQPAEADAERRRAEEWYVALTNAKG